MRGWRIADGGSRAQSTFVTALLALGLSAAQAQTNFSIMGDKP